MMRKLFTVTNVSVLGLLLLLVFPLVAPALNLDFYVSFVRRVLIFALAATSLNFILGYGGMVALGHAAFFGAGAYVVAMLSVQGVSHALIAWPVAMLVAGALAFVIGLISLRTRGVYFIMITLAFAQMVFYLFISLRQYGGEDGINLTGPSVLPGLNLADDRTFYYVVLVVVLACLWWLNRLIQARFGQALQGIRENESRMEALGYPVFRIKLLAFVIAGVMAGLAGALLASHNQFVSPSLMHWTASANLIIMVIVGGIGLRYGGLVGAAVMLWLEEVLRLYTDYWHLPLGVLLLAIVLFAPRGLEGLFKKAGTR
jgi:branched-chain amino acid transport system permease protein